MPETETQDGDLDDRIDELALEVEQTIVENREKMREMGITPPADQELSTDTEDLLQETQEILDQRV